MILDAQKDFGGDLQKAASELGSNKLYIPAGRYSLTDTLHFPDTAAEVYGDGIMTALIFPEGCSGVSFGDKSKTHGVVAGGSVHDLAISTVKALPPTEKSGSIGLGLVRATQVSVERVTVWGGFDVAFDLNNNCYGSELKNCRSIFGNNNVGLNLRQGYDSGGDLSFVNNWLSGNLAAVWIDGAGGGYHFFGGQFSAGHRLTAPRDDLGVLHMNSDYLSGTVHAGLNNNNFAGVSWEGWHQMWAIRSQNGWSGTFDNANFNATQPGTRGLWKADDARDCKVAFENCSLGGSFTNDSGKYMDIQGAAKGIFQLVESNWKMTNTAMRVNGGAIPDFARGGSVAALDGWTMGTTAITANGIYFQGSKLS